ncbi:MAG: leucine-rich repeat protein [Ruminococcus sp.]|nr:leucine-rich repeat protein [Ruminococcus sp.]
MYNNMINVSQRLLSFIIITTILLSMIPLTVIAISTANDEQAKLTSVSATSDEAVVLDSGKCGDSLYWELNADGLLRIFGEGPMYDYNKYYEPSPWYKYRDEPYISEDGAYFLDVNGDTYLPTADYHANNPNGYKVSSIVIEDGVTYIGDWAFYRVCVEEITVPETVEATGIFCFRYSPVLKVLNLPNSLKVLDDFAISRNYLLETVNIGNSLETVGTAGFNNNPSLKQIILPDTCTTINKQLSPTFANINYSKVGLMENCTSLKTVSFGRVTEIPQRTCLGAKIETVIIPNTVEDIGEYAFYSCSSLKTVVFEEGSVCKTIDSSSFSGCTALESITGGTSLEQMGSYSSLRNLKEFEFSPTNKTLLKSQFLNTSLKSVTVSDNISVIPISCFNGMSKLEEIYLPATITDILGSSFNYCSSLKDIYYGGTLSQWLAINKASGWSYKVNSECMLHLADGKSVSLWYNPPVYTVTFEDYDGTVLDVQKIAQGEPAVVPQIPHRENDDEYSYTFAGWDTSFESVDSDITVVAQYEKALLKGMLFVDATGGSGFSLSVADSKPRPQGVIYYDCNFPAEVQVTVTANAASEDEFLGWADLYTGELLSEDIEYTFVTDGNDYIKALYTYDDANVKKVVYLSEIKDRVAEIQYYSTADEFEYSENQPVSEEYDFIGWSLTEEEVRSQLGVNNTVVILSKWQRKPVYVDFCTDGKLVSSDNATADKYLEDCTVTVTAKENFVEDGVVYVFAYWTDGAQILSYDRTFTFSMNTAENVTAVFIDEKLA